MLAGFARNNAWSNHRLHAACAQLPQAALTATRTSFFPSILLTLNHILIVDWYYLDALEAGGRGPALYADETPFDTLGPLTDAQRTSDHRLIVFCDRLRPEDADRPVILVREGDQRFTERTEDVLCHLFTHQVHHRGQVHAMLSGTSAPPPQLDEFFLEQDAPVRAPDLRAMAMTESGQDLA